MSLRRVVNLAERHLFKDSQGKAKENMRMLLNEPFDFELSPKERARAERKRIAMETGAFDSQRSLTGAMSLKGKR